MWASSYYIGKHGFKIKTIGYFWPIFLTEACLDLLSGLDLEVVSRKCPFIFRSWGNSIGLFSACSKGLGVHCWSSYQMLLAFKLQNQKTSGFLEVGSSGGLKEHGTASQAEAWSKGPLEQQEAALFLSQSLLESREEGQKI